ncbi:type VI secretion system Vgr family protein [Chitinophaga varians]|uniref:type VI secretion system Vgr family protein n=1 Tax=Chitinophaga varians TaxID=2202339 RepID=UPI00165FC817|nr:type VI secretion system Vgr family protein [Chitinophaga varians]MBC9913109.1 type VI secretion system tip protein VgrG [Chitinophaga varians]
MSQLTDTIFSINGNPIPQFSAFSLKQTIFDHHQFEFICPAQTIDGITGIFNSSREMIGAAFGAHISGIGLKGDLLFNGIVTSVETCRVNGDYGAVIISGYSPTIMLDSGPHCKTWENKSLKNIAQDVLKYFPQNQLAAKVDPLQKEPFEYVVQYKETAWTFLQRLTAESGEWMFWDGRSLIIGPPPGDTKTKLVYGSSLSDFSINLNARPAQMQYMGWDYHNSELYTSLPKSENVGQKAGLNSLGEKVYEKAQAVYSTQPKQWNFRFSSSKKQQDDMATLYNAMESSKMVRLTGKSGHPGVAAGARIDISGNNVFNGDAEEFGEYLVTSSHHYVDTKGEYSNHFTAIPSSVKLPPVAIPEAPVCEAQSAIVTDNHDPKGLGRIRVKFHWMNGEEKTPWIRVTTPHAGGGKGMFFIPEAGEEVIVGFEGDSAIRPYIIGAVYHGQANNSFGNAANDIKALQTRSGNKIILNDKDGSVLVEDKDGNHMKMDGAGNITVKSKVTIALICGEGEKGKSSITLNKEGEIMIAAEKDIMLKAKKVSGVGSEMVSMGSGTVNGNDFNGSGFSIEPTQINIGAKQKCSIASKEEMEVGTAGKLTMQAGGESFLVGSKVNIN